MSEALPNRYVLVPAIVLLFVGAVSTTRLFLGLWGEGVSLDLSILALPIGYQMLLGDNGSRRLARFGAAIALIGLCVGWAVAETYSPVGHQPWGVTWRLVYDVTIVISLCLIVLLSLRKRRVGDWFSEGRSPAFARDCMLAVGLLAAAYAGERYMVAWEYRSQMERAFPVQVRIRPVDADSGAGLRRSITAPEAIKNTRTRYPYHPAGDVFPKLSFDVAFPADGAEITARGILLEPTEITVRVDGYQDASLKLDRTTEETVRLPMLRTIEASPDE